MPSVIQFINYGIPLLDLKSNGIIVKRGVETTQMINDAYLWNDNAPEIESLLKCMQYHVLLMPKNT